MWEAATGRPVCQFGNEGPLIDRGRIEAIAFSADSRQVVALRAGGAAVLVRDIAAPAQAVRTIELDVGQPLSSSCLSRNGQFVACSSIKQGPEAHTEVWDVVRRAKVCSVPQTGGEVALSGNGQWLAIAGPGATEFSLWAVRSAKRVRVFTGVQYSPHMIFSPDGKILAAQGEGNAIRVWNVASGRPIVAWKNQEPCWFSTFSADSKALFLTSRNSPTRMRVLATGKDMGHWPNVRALAASPDGKRLAGVPGLYTLQLWDATTGKALLTWPTHNDGVTALAFRNDGKVLASWDEESIRVWDVQTARSSRPIRHPQSWRGSLVFRGDRLLAAGVLDEDKPWRVWWADRPKVLRPLPAAGDATLFPDGRTVAIVDKDGNVGVWDTSTGKRRQVFRPPPGERLSTAAISPDGLFLAALDDSLTIRCWHLDTGRQIGSVAVIERVDPKDTSATAVLDVPRAIAFSPDGELIAVGMQYGALSLYELRTGQRICRFAAHAASI
ncbi:MAG TPA: WD40 repeat domain-containing protein, partial [Gemmataceae bacterium]|nr:WD40 repeat domain-containing protein [Gemmataceae bacterium]